MTLRILYFGSYDGAPGRNAIMVEGLRLAGATVVEQHAPVWPSTAAKIDAVSGWTGRWRAGCRQVGAWRRLGTAPAAPSDVVVVGATAHVDLPLAKLVARRARAPLVFDPLISATETIRDRGLLAGQSKTLALLRRVEGALFRLPDAVVADSRAHALAFACELGLNSDSMIVVPAGAPQEYADCRPVTARADNKLTVTYFGQYIPLHGLDVVIGAADRLRGNDHIVFRLVGRGQTLEAVRRQVDALRLPNVELDASWMTARQLVARHITQSDICLGAFGDVPKARRVVPFKVYAGLAAGRAVVSGDTPAVRELLKPGRELACVPVGDPQALAAELLRLSESPRERLALGAAGRAAYAERFSPEVLGGRFVDSLEALVETRLAQRAQPVSATRTATRTGAL